MAALGVISSTVAWFDIRAKLQDERLFLGSSIGAYFGGGDGSAETPYIINTSTHVYNLAWLQYLGFFNEDKTHIQNGEVISGADGVIDKQYYFILESDIEMNGMYIPPIGTETNPFLGNFNGNNHVITDFTTSNILGDNHISKKPTVVTSLSGTDIIGFFGVVGELPSTTLTYNSAVNSIYNFGLDNFEIESQKSTNGNLVGLAAGYLNGDIGGVGIGESKFDLASGITAIPNSRIDSNKTTSNISDYGLVGYCTSDQLKTSKIVTVNANEPKVRKASASGSGTFEGASIPMSEIYTRLNTLRGNATRPQYISETTRYFDENDQEITARTTDVYTDSPNVGQYTASGQTSQYYYADIATPDPNGNTFASYSFARRIRNGSFTDGDFIYISGSDEVTVSNTGRTYHDYHLADLSATYIYKTVSGTNHYLTINGTTGITDSTSATTKWIIDGGRIYTIVNDQKYYLNRSSTTAVNVSQTQSASNLWSESNNVYVNANNNNYYYLRYNNGWGVAALGTNYITVNGYYISDGDGNYLSANGTTSLVNRTSQDTATIWTIDDTGYVYITSGGRNYYVRSSARNGSTTLAFSNSTNYRYTRSNNVLRYRRGGGYDYYYVYYNGSNWAASTTSRNLTFEADVTITASGDTYNVSTTSAGTVKAYPNNPTNSTGVASYKTMDTYFPLKYATNDSDADLGNIGYVVGGSRFYDSGQMISDMRVSRYDTSKLSATFNQNTYSNSTRSSFKVLTKTYKTYNNSKYSSNNYFAVIGDNYNNGAEDANVTISGSTYKYSRYGELGLTKYGEARDDLDATWKPDGENIYGLHFMNAAINKNEKIAVDKAVIGDYTFIKEDDGYYHQYETLNSTDEHGNVITDGSGNPVKETHQVGLVSGAYEMPMDCIDFNLAENATINFFAGSYFSGNNAFFSLHRIFRKTSSTTTTIDDEEVEISNRNQIDEIKEIRYVYKNTEYSVANREAPRYIYRFTDNSYGYGDELYVQSGNSYICGDKVFDTSVVGDMLFDTNWIKGASGSTIIENASYYFEIPAVRGEYALGSIDGKTGAYLMYLDIGASDISDDTINVTEKVNLYSEIYSHPDGVDFCVLPLGENETFAAIITSDVVGTIVIPTGVSGDDISFSLEETENQETTIVTHVLTCGPPSSGSITQSTYIGDNTTITCNSNPLTAVSTGWINDERTITTKYTYNKEELALVIQTVYSSLITSNTDSEGVADGYTETSDPIACTEEDYDMTYKIEPNEVTGLTPYVSFSYYSLTDEDPEVTCVYNCTHNADESYVYIYDFTITTTSDIVIHVDSLITSISQTVSVEIYTLRINGVNYSAGDVAIIRAS